MLCWVLQGNWAMSFQLHHSKGVLGYRYAPPWLASFQSGFHAFNLGCCEACIANTFNIWAIFLAHSWRGFLKHVYWACFVSGHVFQVLRFDCDNEVANPGPLKASKLGAFGLQLFSIIEQHPCSPWALGSSSVKPLHSSGEEFVRASVKGVMARCSLNGSADSLWMFNKAGDPSAIGMDRLIFHLGSEYTLHQVVVAHAFNPST